MKMVNEALEITEDFYRYNILDYDENLQLVLELPKYPDNCGWFRAKYPDGRTYTLYGFDSKIKQYIDEHPDDDEVEADEDNQYIELKNDLLKLVSSKTTKENAKDIVDELWDNYKIERPNC